MNAQTTLTAPAASDTLAAAVAAREAATAALGAYNAHVLACPCCLPDSPGHSCADGRTLAWAAQDACNAAADAHVAHAPLGSLVACPGSDRPQAPWRVTGLTSDGSRYRIICNPDGTGDHVLEAVPAEQVTPLAYVRVPAEWQAELGMPPVRFTAAAWLAAVSWTDEDSRRTGVEQDEYSRCCDVLATADWTATGRVPARAIEFPIDWWSRDTLPESQCGYEPEPDEGRLRLSADADEQGRPVLTVSLPEPGEG